MFGNKAARIQALTEEKEILFQSLEEGVLIVDEEMIITDVSRSTVHLLKVQKRELIGKRVSSCLQPDLKALLDKIEYLLETCQQTGIPMTDSILIEEKRKIYLELMAIPKNSSQGAILLFQDKSSHYKVVEMGKDFVANASHELKTPITIIKGFAETLQDIGDLPKEIYLDIIEKIVRNCQRMEKLVKNLLTLADLESLPFSRFEACDLKALLTSCKEMEEALHPQAHFRIECPHEDVFVLADVDLLELAIINLIENAVKYSKGPAQIDLIVESHEGEICLQIKDQGMGIPEEALEHIFDRFYTVNKAYARRLGGAGLGLSIVKNIIEKHQGRITAASVLGEGTTFSLNLPRQELED